MSKWRAAKDWAMITLGTLIVAVAIYFFMLPSHLAIGSCSALSMVLSNFIPLPVSVLNMIMNVLLLSISFVLIGPDFGVKTVYSALLMPVFLAVFEVLLPNVQSITQDRILDACCYMLVVSAGMGILFSRNASSGGLDIVAKLMNKYLRMNLGSAMALSGMLVALTSAFSYDKTTVVVSVLGTYFCGLLTDHFIFGMNIKRRICILSSKWEEIVQYILHDLHSGATLSDVIGAYGNVPRREVIVIADNQEYRKLMNYLQEIDPKAFITVYSVSEISYQPKK